MATIGPIPLNGGWVSESDIWNDPGEGRALTYSCFMPWEGGAKTCDNFGVIGSAVPSATQILGLFYWQDPAQEGVPGTDIYIAMAPFKCYTSIASSGTWTDRTSSASLPGGNFYTFGVLNGKVIIANSFQNSLYAPFKISAYNGNIASLGGSPPTCGIVKVVNNFAFLAQNLSASTTISRVYWSNVADPETWGAANFIDVNFGDGDIITGLSSIGSNLIIFKTNSIWNLSTISNVISGAVTLGPLSVVSNKYGCVGQHALDIMPDGTIVFISSDGHLYKTDGLTFIDFSHNPWPNSNISVPIVLGNINGNQFYSPYYFNMVKVDSESHRIFVINSAFSGTHNSIYVLDYLRLAWADWSNLNTGTDNVFYITTLPYMNNSVHSYGGVRPRIVFGSYAGNLYFNFPEFLNGSNVFDQSVQLNCTLEYTISLLNQGKYFTPYWLTIPYNQPNGSGGILTVTVGYDGVYQSSPLSTSFPSGGYGRLNLKVPYTNTIPSTIRPLTIQIKIVLNFNATGGVTVIEPIYLSDEMQA